MNKHNVQCPWCKMDIIATRLYHECDDDIIESAKPKTMIINHWVCPVCGNKIEIWVLKSGNKIALIPSD